MKMYPVCHGDHRRRLLELTLGAKFPLIFPPLPGLPNARPSVPPPPFLLPSLPSSLPLSSAFPVASSPVISPLPFPFLCPYIPYPLNPATVSGGAL